MSAVPRYAVMWSGGKDSALALVRAREQDFEIGCLINVIDAATRRVRFHATRAELIAAQAEDPERRAVWDAVWREVHAAADERYHRSTTS